MEILTLPPGESAPSDSDCISIVALPNGRFAMTGSLLTDVESVALVSGPEYASVNDATNEGLAWAESNQVATLYVATPASSR